MASALYDHDIEAEKIKRRRAVSEALLAQSMQPMGGTESVGGIAVRRSPLEGIAQVAKAYMAQKGIDKSDTEAKDLGERVRGDTERAIGDYTRAISPRAAVAGAMQEDASGNVYTTDDQPGYAPTQQDKQLAAFKLMGAAGGDPRDTAKLIVANAMKPDTSFAKVDPKDYTPESVASFRQSGDYSVLRPRTKVEVSGGTAYDPHATAPGTNVGSTEIERELRAAGLQPGTPAWTQAMADRVSKQTTHQPPTALQTVEVKQEGAEKATVGKGFGEQYLDLQRGGIAASTKLAQIDRMEQLLQGMSTGALAPTSAQVAAIGQSMGFKIDQNLGAKQALEALSNEMALSLRNPSGGAGMPGALSDKDREFLKAMTPGLAKTPEGNALVLQTMRKLAQRDQQVAQLARDYRSKSGQLDEGFYNELAAYSARNPLFQAPAAAGGNPEIDALLKKYGAGAPR